VALKVLRPEIAGALGPELPLRRHRHFRGVRPGRGSRIAMRFDDPTRPWHRYGFRVFRDRFYFTVGDRQSHVRVAEIGGR
jgi:hypothetical protein